MMSIMSNGEIGSIKKQIFLALGLFFSCSQLTAATCPQTVGAVTPGESIWKVTSRIGQATNVIESQLCVLSAEINGGCSFTFDQTDIGAGDLYTITVPGIYCLTENVTFTFGTAVTVNSSDVTIDLQGHYIDGGSNLITAAIGLTPSVGSSLNNLIIQNGIIQNLGSINIPYGIVQTSTTSCLSNIIIRDMDFYNINTLGTGYAFFAQAQEILVENCNTFDGGYLQANGANGESIFRNIRAEQYASGYSGVIAFGASSVVIEDCIMTTSAPTPGSGLAQVVVAESFNAVIRNCVVDGSINAGFIFSDINNLVVSDCIAQNIVGHGFQLQLIDAISGVVIERCVAQNNEFFGFNFLQTATSAFDSLSVIDCIANNNMSSGFLLVACGILGSQNILFKNCYAAQNGVCGFLMLGVGGNVLNSSFEGCVAQANGGDGFNLENIGGGLPFAHISFTDCVSQGNIGGAVYGPPLPYLTCVSSSTNLSDTGYWTSTFLGDGFGLNSALTSTIVGPISDVICQGCLAQRNANDGFNFASTVTQCKIFDCCAMNNTGTGIANAAGNTNRVLGNAAFDNGDADISGVSDPSLLVSSTLAGGLAGAPRWVNAIS